jgi:hypothetical protein
MVFCLRPRRQFVWRRPQAVDQAHGTNAGADCYAGDHGAVVPSPGEQVLQPAAGDAHDHRQGARKANELRPSDDNPALPLTD